MKVMYEINVTKEHFDRAKTACSAHEADHCACCLVATAVQEQLAAEYVEAGYNRIIIDGQMAFYGESEPVVVNLMRNFDYHLGRQLATDFASDPAVVTALLPAVITIEYEQPS